jgi:hypothetical protein
MDHAEILPVLMKSINFSVWAMENVSIEIIQNTAPNSRTLNLVEYLAPKHRT